MMTAWTLIAASYYGEVQHIEFGTQRACIEAREIIKTQTPPAYSIKTMCVPKRK